MKWFAIILVSVLSPFTHAQYTFRYEHSDLKSPPNSFVETQDGYIIVSLRAIPNKKENPYFIKINKKGEFQWENQMDDPHYNQIYNIQFDGKYLYGLGNASINNQRLTFSYKFDSQGNLIYKKQIGTVNYTSKDNRPSKVLIRKNGNILYTNSEYNLLTQTVECIIYTTNAEGDILHRLALAQDSLFCTPYDMIETSDKGLVVTMQAWNNITREEKSYLIKFDKNNNELWRTQVITTDTIQKEIQLCEVNNEIFCASSTAYNSPGIGRLSLLKYSSNGNKLLETNYGNYIHPTNPQEFVTVSMFINHDSTNIIVSGSFADSTDIAFGPILLFADLEGQITQTVTVPFLGVKGNGWGLLARTTADNGIALLVRNFHVLPKIGAKAELVKLDCNGNWEWSDACKVVNTNLEVVVFPNPSNGVYGFYLQNTDKNTAIHFSLFDITGRLIQRKIEKGSFFETDISNFADGIYAYQIFINNKEYAAGKLLKVK